MKSSAKRELSLFVVSDYHAYDSTNHNGAAPSWFDIGSKSRQAPHDDLVTTINERALRADILVCCGDLSEKANPPALAAAWQHLQDLRKALRAKHLIVTAGNHDVDSRHQYNDHDARGHLQDLIPRFPDQKISRFDQYWSRHFYKLTKKGLYQIVSLNSAAYHGLNDEHEHGRISHSTLKRLSGDVLTPASQFPLNVLITHHPPHRQAERNQGEMDAMKGGDDLLEALDNGSSQWLLIHGHKHYPKLQYARGGSDSAVLLSAGPTTAKTYQDYGRDAKNQVHRIVFDLDYIADHDLCGVIQTLDWSLGTGWQLANGEGGLPAYCGFGCRLGPKELAQRMAKLVQGKILWEDALSRDQRLAHCMSEDLHKAFVRLESEFEIRVVYDNRRQPVELAKVSE